MLEEIRKERLKKERAYPARVKRTHLVADFLKDFSKLSKKTAFLAGRIMGMRGQGGILFLDLKDESGKIQAVLKKDDLGNFDNLKANLDIGDFVEIDGSAFKTKAGEKSVLAKSARMIVKSLLPLPSVWHGLKDVEERYRKRYLDLLLNDEARGQIEKRSEIVHELRETLCEEGFMEVETPMLQPIAGGAKARPFKTHHNALDTDFYLRIAPELYLKRLLVSGFERIFEIGRNFRNEGIDRDHNPEFTMLELYWAYHDYNDLIKFSEKLLKKWIPGKWEKITFAEACKKYGGKDYKNIPAGELDEFFKHNVRPKLIKPTLVLDYPESAMALAKLKEGSKDLTESFQLIVNGAEIAKGFSELNDPVYQRKQMEEQEKAFRAGDEEMSRRDEDFLEALEHGMPPAAGMGIGIDRLAALVSGASSVKEVIIFPTLRPKKE